jgi:hypothetical protein
LTVETKLTRVKLDQIIDEFHESVHTEEVNRHLQGILPAPEVLNPPAFAYELEERATVARLLFQPLDEIKLNRIFHVRIQLVQAPDYIREVYLTSAEVQDPGTRRLVVEIAALHRKELGQKRLFQDLIHGLGDFTVDLLLKIE